MGWDNWPAGDSEGLGTRSPGLVIPGGVSGYDEDGVLLPEELLSVMPDAGLKRSVFTSILTGVAAIDDVMEQAVVTGQAFVNAKGVEQRFSMPKEDNPFIRFSADEDMGRRFFFALFTGGGDLVMARFKGSVSIRFSPATDNQITI